MRRLAMDPRPNWQKRVEEYGLMYHTLKGEPYWDETAAYQLTAYQVDQLELATNTLHEMCMDIVQDVIDDSENLFNLFLIPSKYRDFVVQSWVEGQPSLYGRFDLAYDGVHPPKLLEYNADTPTGLVEAAVAQWYWLKDIDERGDQFNSIHERLIDGWKRIRQTTPSRLYFAALSGNIEDFITVEYLRDTAIQAGFDTQYIDIEQVGWDNAKGGFVDRSGSPMRAIFKLYPWEWMLREDFGPNLRLGNPPTRWFEPPWKMILSCKSILPLLYEKYPDSPFLLPASFEPMDGDHVRKPIHAREGSNIQVVKNNSVVFQTEGPYPGPFVYQRLASLPCFEGRYPVLGSWVVEGVSCGVGIREDDQLITTNLSRFVPHQMVS